MLQSQTTGSHGWQVILAGCGVGIAAGYQLCKIMNNRSSSKNEGFSSEIAGNKAQAKKTKNADNLDEEEQDKEEYERIVSEQLVRNIQFFGEEGQDKVNKSYVIIFGVGGIGSHLASSLARSGVRRLKIVDSDQISLSSLNSHAFATREDLGRTKVDCVKDYIHRIVPRTVVESVYQRVSADNVEKFFEVEHQPSYVIDCMDDIDAKVALLAYCKHNKIRAVSSMGAELKADPTMLQIRDISEITYDDLSRAVRNRLKAHGVTNGIKFAVNAQRPDPEQILSFKKQQEDNTEKSRLPKTPVLGTMPALIAYSISSYVLCDLAESQFEPFPIEDVKQSSYLQLYQNLVKQGTKVDLFSFEQLKFDKEDMYIIAKQIYGWKDLLNDKKVCGGVIVRWNPELGFNPENLVLLSSQDAKKHMNFKEYKEIISYYKEEIVQKVARKQAEYEAYIKKHPVLYK